MYVSYTVCMHRYIGSSLYMFVVFSYERSLDLLMILPNLITHLLSLIALAVWYGETIKPSSLQFFCTLTLQLFDFCCRTLN